MDIKEKIGLRIKEIRIEQNLTQEGLAFKADVDRTYMNHVENGRRNISVTIFEKILNALEISFQDFFTHSVFTEKVKGGKNG